MINIPQEDINKRVEFPSPNTSLDYIKDGSYRKIIAKNDTIIFRDKIFNERTGITLETNNTHIEIKNCEFKKGFFLNRGKNDYNYKIFIYKSNFSHSLTLNTYDARNNVSIDTSIITEIFLSGKSDKIDFYKTKVTLLHLESLRCDSYTMIDSEVNFYSLYKFTSDEVEFDTENIAISDYSRFKTHAGQTKKEVSEIYHKFALKGVKSLKSSNSVHYQLTKATSTTAALFFGYFYKPFNIVFWILIIVLVYANLYYFILHMEPLDSLYFSSYTFLTIGYNDVKPEISLIKTILIFSEGLLGIVYAAALLTSIINTSKK